MAYTIIRSNGTTLTTIQDGTINTTSTSLGLPGRNYAGYGQSLNTNMVRSLENFAADTPPTNPLKGQLWFNTVNNTLNVCPLDGTSNSLAWLTLTSTNSGGSTTLGNLTVTGNILTNNLSVTHDTTTDTIVTRLATVSDTLQAQIATITTGTIAGLTTQSISTGASGTGGTLTGSWTVIGNTASGGNAFSVQSGNIAFAAQSVHGIKCDTYMYANGSPFNPSGTYTNGNVHDYMTGANSVVQFTGNIAPTKVTTTNISGGGTISGIWTLTTGARIQATYADLAERYAADAAYPVGTVVELGGEKEITIAKAELSEDVFGVVSDSYAYLLNEGAGTDETHPAVGLIGRVKVNAVGKVTKGQRLVSAGNGVARGAAAGEATAFNVIGRSLTNKETEEAGIIEAVVVAK